MVGRHLRRPNLNTDQLQAQIASAPWWTWLITGAVVIAGLVLILRFVRNVMARAIGIAVSVFWGVTIREIAVSAIWG